MFKREQEHDQNPEHPTRLALDPGQGALGQIPRLHPADCQTDQHPPLRDPIGQPRNIPDPGPQALGLAALQLRVFALDIGPAVMRQMEIAKPLKGQKQQQPTKPPHRFIQPCGCEGSFVGGFMFKREQEHDQNPLYRHQQAPQRHPRRDQRAHRQNAPQMQAQMPQPRTIPAQGQPGFLGPVQSGKKRFVIHRRALFDQNGPKPPAALIPRSAKNPPPQRRLPAPQGHMFRIPRQTQPLRR